MPRVNDKPTSPEKHVSPHRHEWWHPVGLALCLLLTTAIMWALDATGVLLYLAPAGYWFLRVMAIPCAVTGLFWSYRATRTPAPMALLSGAAILLFAIFAWVLPSLPTSPRKEFYLSYERARRARTLTEIKRILAPYPTGQIPLAPGEYSVYHSDGKSTLDVIHVRCQPITGRVVEVSIALD